MDNKPVLSIDKELEEEPDDLPTITYQISSSQETSFRLRLTEQLPESIEANALQIPGEHTDNWSVIERTAVYECRVEPQEEFHTSFKVRTNEMGQLGALSGAPPVEVASAKANGDEPDWQLIPRKYLDVDRFRLEDRTTTNALASDGGDIRSGGEKITATSESSNPDSEGTTTEESQDRIESAIPPMNGESIETERPSSRDDADTTHSSATAAASETESGSLVDQFLEALQEESLSAEQQQTLRTAVGLDSTTSTHARIEQCQTRLSDLSAYIDALQEFLDEEGTGQQLIEDFQSDLAAVEKQVAALETEISTIATTQDELNERIDSIEQDLSSIQSVAEDVESVETRLDETTNTLTEDIDTLRAAVEDLEDWQATVTGAFAGSANDEE